MSIPKFEATIKTLRATERELFERDRNSREGLYLAQARIVLQRLMQAAQAELERAA